MMPEDLVSYATIIASVILSVAFLMTVYRVLIGPTLPDRVIALDMLVGIAIGFIAVIAIRTSFNLYVDIAIALGLVGFLATVAFARFILSRKPSGGRDKNADIEGENTQLLRRPAQKQGLKSTQQRKSATRKKRGN
jgi:multicomponent Na+:H+ antiporter subunit F